MTTASPRVPGYILMDQLGTGTYATVRKAKKFSDTSQNQSQFVAIKCIRKDSLTKAAENNLVTEIEVLKKLKHEHIVEMRDFLWDDTFVYLLMELCASGDLSHYLRTQPEKRVSERQTRAFTRQLASALVFMHSQKVLHMDLKPHNILLTLVRASSAGGAGGAGAASGAASMSARLEPHLKIADFGFAKHYAARGHNASAAAVAEDQTLRGNYLYMASEVLKDRNYTEKCDVWSLGVIVYECLVGMSFFLLYS